MFVHPREVKMKHFRPLWASTMFCLASVGFAQMPPGVTPEMIASALPEEDAPKAVPGSYKVSQEPAFGMPSLMTFRPSTLDRFPTQDKLPVVVWGNGGCAINGPRYYGFLETIASHGFLVITTAAGDAPPPAAAAPAGAPPGARPRSATAADLKAGIDWAESENTRAGSALRNRIDTQQVAVMGQSCGGRLSMELGADPRVDTIGVFNAGLQEGQFDLVAKLHGPVLLINGHERDFMMAPSKATFDAITNLPTFYGARHGAGHTATAYHAGGGEFANVASNWVRWQFKGDREAAKMFVGAQCALCTNPTWDTAAKRLE
jgi:dienelactone hydrolase